MRAFFQEFKTFAIKGNMMSMAVGILIGAAFQGLVTSLTENILSPIIGLFVRQNFDYLELTILSATIRYGTFITALINFLVMAFVVFLIIRAMNKLLAFSEKNSEPEAPERKCRFCMSAVHQEAKRCPACTSDI